MPNYQESIKSKRTEAVEKQEKQAYVGAIAELSTSIKTLLDSLETTKAKKLDKEYVQAIKRLETVYKGISSIRVTSDNDIKRAIRALTVVLGNLDPKPVVNVAPPTVNVQERELDFKPLIKALDKFKPSAPVVNMDVSELEKGISGVKKAINSLSFPTANYILPFRDPATGKATQITLTSDGKLPAETTVDTTGLATEAKQDTQITELQQIEADVETVNTTLGSPAQEHTTAGSPHSVRLTDGSSFYKATTPSDTQPVSASSLPLPTGAATAANQQTDALTDTELRASPVVVDLGANNDVTVTSSVLPTGASTSAKQDTVIGHLDGVEGLLTTIDADTGTLAGTVSGSEVQVDVVAALPTGTNAIGRTGHDITGIGHGVKTVTSAGTDEALAGSTACKRVTIQAQTDNTSAIAIGGSGVDATVATGTGILLYPGDVFELEIDNLADIYVDALVNGEGVRYAYFT